MMKLLIVVNRKILLLLQSFVLGPLDCSMGINLQLWIL
jgi:hypothetical protein